MRERLQRIVGFCFRMHILNSVNLWRCWLTVSGLPISFSVQERLSLNLAWLHRFFFFFYCNNEKRFFFFLVFHSTYWERMCLVPKLKSGWVGTRKILEVCKWTVLIWVGLLCPQNLLGLVSVSTNLMWNESASWDLNMLRISSKYFLFLWICGHILLPTTPKTGSWPNQAVP